MALSVMVAASLTGGTASAAVSVEHGIIESWDTTDIYYTIFEPPGPFVGDEDGDIPVVFMTHGWGGSRVKDPANPRVAWLTDRGYAVVTWDSRGFGQSGGEANADSQEFEVRDLRRLIDTIVVRPEIATDDVDFDEVTEICEEPIPSPTPVDRIGPLIPDAIETILFGPSPSPSPTEEPTCTPTTVTIHHVAMDPKMGMMGGSYAGGIQLMAASMDPRIDAIIPEITWNDLPHSLKPNGVLKIGWDLLLYASGAATSATGGLANQPQVDVNPTPVPGPVPEVSVKHGPETGAYAPQIHQSLVEGVALNDWSTATFDWFDQRSTKHYVDGGSLADDTPVPGVNAATMLIQGINDTLFPIDEAIKTYEAIKDRVPAKLVFFCGGHTWGTISPSIPLNQGCQAGAGQEAHLESLRERWLARYVKGQTSVDPGAAVEYPFQGGTAAGDVFYARAGLPDTDIFSSRLQVKGDTRLKNVVVPTNGTVIGSTVAGCHINASRADVTNPAASCPARVTEADWLKIGTFTGPPAPGDRTRQPTLEFPQGGTVILGKGRVRIGVLTTGPDAYYFVKLLEWDPIAKKATVIGDQVSAVKVTWGSLDVPKYVSFDLNGVAWKIKNAQVDSLGQLVPYEYYLEVTTTSNTHASSRYPNQSTIFVDASIPVITPPRVVTPATNSSPKPITEPERVAVNTASPTFEGTAEPGSVLTIKDFGTAVDTAVTDADGEWAFTRTWTEGHHIMNIGTPSDLDGRDIMSSGDRCFVVDDPTITPNAPVVTAPLEGATVTTSSVKFEGTAQAGTTVFVHEGATLLGSKKTSGCPAKDLLGNVTGAGLWSVSKSGMSAGSHTVTITAKDASGNISSAVTRTFTKA